MTLLVYVLAIVFVGGFAFYLSLPPPRTKP